MQLWTTCWPSAAKLMFGPLAVPIPVGGITDWAAGVSRSRGVRGAHLLNVGDVVMKVPLNQVDLQHEKGRLIFDGATFHVMGLFGEHAARLAEYVSESGSSTPS